jgi:putative FmdB family regulatory protein
MTFSDENARIPSEWRYNLWRVHTRGDPMPVYDYICHDCNKSFETVLTLKEHDKEKIACPHCGSKNVEQEAAAFFAVTGKKS